MSNKMPRTPFSTPLSGSAKETELRLKNIFSGPKKRPPALFLALMFAVCLFCGNLVSCNVAQAEGENIPNARQPDRSSGGEREPSPVTYGPADPPLSEAEQTLLETLVRAADGEQPFQLPTASLLASIQKESQILGVVFVEDFLENTLLLGVMDRETHALTGPLFRYAVHGGVPHAVPFQSYDGRDCLLYTLNGQENGQYDGQAGVIRFDGQDLTWSWPVEGDVRDPDSAAAREYADYWNGHLAVMAPGGVDVYTVNPEFEWGKDEPWSMWQLECGEAFYQDPSGAGELSMPIYFQSLQWLNEYANDPGGWRVVSLTLNEERCDPEKMADCYTLCAREELGDGELTADLFFNYETEPSRPRAYDGLDHGEVREGGSKSPSGPEADG